MASQAHHKIGRLQAFLLTFAMATSATSGAWADDRDPWFGRDKALHFGVSVVLGAGGYAGSALIVDRPWQRALLGGAFSLTIGAGKELVDMTGYGDPSWKDFTWDVIGTAVGVGIALLIDLTVFQHGRTKSEPTSTKGGVAPTWATGALPLAGGRSTGSLPASVLCWTF
jgi:putative lipoprotein